MGEMVALITPVLLHMILSELVVIFGGSLLDPATCTALTALLVIFPAVLMHRRDDRKYGTKAVRENTGSGAAGNRVVSGICCCAAGGVLNVLWSGVLNALHISEYFSNQTQETLLGSAVLIQIFGLGILVPVAEELIFRALVYTRMKRIFPVKCSVFLSAVLFAVYHGNPIQMIFAFPMAMLLAVIYERGQSLIFPVLFHVGVNLTAVFLDFL